METLLVVFYVGVVVAGALVLCGRAAEAIWAVFLAAIVLFFLSGCSLSVAGRPVVAVDNGVAGRTVGGAAAGAAAGAAGGAIAGDPGKGAAVGAAAGGVIGLLSGILGGSSYGALPSECRIYGENSPQCEAYRREYDAASTERAARRGRCSGGDRSACRWWGGYGGWDDGGWDGGGLGWYGNGWSRHRRGWW